MAEFCLYAAMLLMASERLVTNERPRWLAGLCRLPLGLIYRVRLPPRASDGDRLDYRASAAGDRSPWRSLPTLTVDGARIDALPGTDAFVVSPTSWQRSHLTRIEIVRSGDELDLRASYVPSPVTWLPVALVGAPAFLRWADPHAGTLSFVAIGLIAGIPVQLFRARRQAMEHGRLAMERLGDALRAPGAEPGDFVGPPWGGRASFVLGLMAVPVLAFLFSIDGGVRGRPAPSTLAADWNAVERYVESALRREADVVERGLGYRATIHSGLARLDDGTLLAQRATEVTVARRSTAACAALADGWIEEQVLQGELAISGEDALRSWDVQIAAAVRHELDGTGEPLPADPEAVVEEAFERALSALPADDAAGVRSRLTLDRDGDVRSRCDTYLAQETLVSSFEMEERAAVLRAMHLVAAREARARGSDAPRITP